MSKLAERLYERWFGDKRRGTAIRAYAAANRTRANSDWIASTTTSNYETRISITALRARARQMVRDDAYCKKFLAMAESNVVGSEGIQLDVRAKKPTGKFKGVLNKDLNDRVKQAWWEWGSSPDACSTSGKLDLVQQQKLFIRQFLRDGEVLFVKKNAGPWGFQLKNVDPAYLDENYNQLHTNGNRIVMSVEVDADDKPVAYWLTPPSTEMIFANRDGNRTRTRVAAEDVIHAFAVIDDESQVRGITYFHAGLVVGKNRHEYTKAVLIAAKQTAMSRGYIIPPDGDEAMAEKWVDPETGEPITPEVDITPGSVTLLPPGYTAVDHDPNQPTQNHEAFEKLLIHEIAASFGLNYFSLAGDMDAVNYSSARVGLAEEREGLWRGLQGFMATHFLNAVFASWLPSAIASGNLDLSADEYRAVQKPYWRPRGWDYVDPQKEINADILGISSGLLTVSGVLSRRGIDIRDHLETIQQDKALFEEFGVDYPQAPSTANDQPPAGDPEEDKSPKEKRRELLNGHADLDEDDAFVS